MFTLSNYIVIFFRYFVVGVMEQIQEPYSPEFIETFYSLIGNSEIFDNSTLEKNLIIKKFVQTKRP